MAANTKSIIFKITEAGKQSALQASGDDTKILIDLTHVAVGKSKYTPTGGETSLKNEVGRSDIVSGEVVGNTLRFTSTMYADDITPVYEMGIFTKTGVLFAVAASSTDPLVTLYPNIAFVAAFGVAIDDIGKGSITVSTDPNNSLATVLMQNHVAATNPHPQYVALSRFQLLLDVMFPVGYLHHTNSATNPKAKFDQLLGINTFWRRLTGKIIVGTDPNDNYIKDVGIVLGQKGMTELASVNERPNVYPLYTKHIFERYNPDDVIETVWNISANKSSITEGGAVRFTVTANNIPDGQILNWTIKEGRLNSGSNDITTPDKSQSGTVILKNASASIDFTTTPDDNAEEPQKHVRLTIGAPASLSINVPINDLGNNESVMHITQSTTSGMQLDEYYKQQSGDYPTATDKIRFIVDAGVNIIAPNTSSPALIEGANWPSGSQIVVENHGRILGRGGDGGRSAYKRKFWGSDGSILSTSKSLMRNPEAGSNGGTAVKSLMRAIVIENHNIIAGGGGGGGGLGAYKTGGSAGYVVGGGGTGGGAPYGLRSPNESTYTMYLQDNAITDPKLPLPDSGFYAILFQRVAGSVANASGSSGDYYYPSQYDASDIEETRGINVEVSTTSTGSRASGDFSKYRIAHSAGYALNNAIDLKMSRSATLNSKGLGGANLAASITDSSSATSLPYPEGDDPTLTRGGDGGGFGESGQSGYFDKLYLYTGDQAVNASPSDMEWYIPPASGGLAGYVKEGSVTITNYSGGTTKGR